MSRASGRRPFDAGGTPGWNWSLSDRWQRSETSGGRQKAMPTNIRTMLSIVVALVAVAVFYFEHQAGQGFLKWFVSILGALGIGAIWLFPEAKTRGDRPT